jgi:hypothetical protein
MKVRCKVNDIEILLSEPIRLDAFSFNLKDTQCRDNVRSLHKKHGIYLIVNNPKLSAIDKNFVPGGQVIYIGKAVGESIRSRNKKHYKSISNIQGTCPGKRMRIFAEHLEYDASKLWVIPGIMDEDLPYMITCAEAILLWNYKTNYGQLPAANTAKNT